MKKTILSLFVLLTIALSHAQNNNTIAKLKYQDAEEAFNTSNYELTITKLKETEDLLQATNPKIMYLKVLAQFGIAQKATDFNEVQKARGFSELYMSKYGDIEGNEDKFRDIYKISEKLKEYPATAEEFKAMANANAFMEYQYLKDVQLGWTGQQVQALPQYKNHKVSQGMLVSNKELFAPVFILKNNKIAGYSMQKSGNMAEANQLVEDLTKLFRFEPTKTSQSGAQTYTWMKNGKMVMIMAFDSKALQMLGLTISDDNIN